MLFFDHVYQNSKAHTNFLIDFIICFCLWFVIYFHDHFTIFIIIICSFILLYFLSLWEKKTFFCSFSLFSFFSFFFFFFVNHHNLHKKTETFSKTQAQSQKPKKTLYIQKKKHIILVLRYTIPTTPQQQPKKKDNEYTQISFNLLS